MGDASSPAYERPEPLGWRHSCTAFDCGNELMNDWLRRRALDNEGKVSRTYVIADGGNSVIAYYSLATGRIDRFFMPKRLQHNLPEMVPVIVLGRLAVDRNHASLGIGSFLLREAIQRTLEVSQNVGVRALLVHVIDEAAIAFYEQYGFLMSPTQGDSLILPIETLQKSIVS
jgi:GNAT superfamily N-acetyltransferase